MFRNYFFMTLLFTTTTFSGLEAAVKAIIFDCDGTLVDSEYAHHETWQAALSPYGYALSLEEYCSTCVGKSVATIASNFAEKLGQDCAADLIRAKREHY